MEYAVVWKMNTCPGIPFFAYCLAPSDFSIARSSEEYHFKKKYITYLCSSFGETRRKRFRFGKQSGLAVPAGKTGIGMPWQENRKTPLGDRACCQKKLEKVKFCNDGT